MTAIPVQAVQQVDRYIHSRRETDRPLVGWGLYFFLLSWITFGIYPMIVFYRRMNRAEQFRLRKQNYYNATLAFTSQYAEEIGEYGAVRDTVDDLDRYINDRSAFKLRETERYAPSCLPSVHMSASRQVVRTGFDLL